MLVGIFFPTTLCHGPPLFLGPLYFCSHRTLYCSLKFLGNSFQSSWFFLTVLSPTKSLPIIFSLVTTCLTKGLFTATSPRTADRSLTSGISRQYDTSSDTRFHSTSSLRFPRNPLSSHFFWGLTTSLTASWSTLIRRSFLSKSAVTYIPLSNGTIIKYVNPSTKNSFHAPSFFPSSSWVQKSCWKSEHHIYIIYEALSSFKVHAKMNGINRICY